MRAPFSNRETGISSGPAPELEESSFIESVMIDSVIMISVRNNSSSCVAIGSTEEKKDPYPVCLGEK